MRKHNILLVLWGATSDPLTSLAAATDDSKRFEVEVRLDIVLNLDDKISKLRY